MSTGGRTRKIGVLKVRAMRTADLAQVLEIETASFGSPWSSRTFLNLLRRPNAALFVAEEVPGYVLGYAVIWFAGPEGELGDLAVRSTVRRLGVASTLLASVMADAHGRGATEIYLEVRESNEAARALYDRHGFEVVNRRPEYYSDPEEDALVMRFLVAQPARDNKN